MSQLPSPAPGSVRPTRRHLLRLVAASAVAPFGLFRPNPAGADGEPSAGVEGTIYVYAADIWERDVEPVRGIFAVDPRTHKWTKVADQSESLVLETRFRVSHDGRSLTFPRYGEGTDPEPIAVVV